MSADRIDPEPEPDSADAGRWTRVTRLVHRAENAAAARPVVWAVTATGLLAAMFFLFLTPTFESNDDVAMMFITDGTFYGSPQPHLVFQSPLVGVVLAALYRWTAAVDWYSVWLYGLHAVALAVVLYAALSDRRTRIATRLASVAAFGSVFTMWMWMHLQFTSAAITLGAAGVLLYLAVGVRDAVPYRVFVIAGVLVGAASLVRWRSFQAVVLLALLPVAAALPRVPWRRQALFAGGALAVVLIGMSFTAIFYAGDDDWHDYFEFNGVRSSVHNMPRGAMVNRPDVRDAAGWTAPDALMFRSWFYLDEEVYTTESLEAVVEATGTPTNDLWAGLGRLGAGDGLVRLIVLGLTLVGGAALLGTRGRVVLAVAVVWCGAVAAGLIVFARLPSWVSVPMLAFLTALAVLHPEAAFGASSPNPPAVRWVAVGAGLLALAIGLPHAAAVAGRTTDNDVADANFFAMTNRLADIDPNGVFVSWGNALAPQRVSPTTSRRVAATLIPLGWHQRSPMHDRRLADLGITDLYRAIATDEHVAVPLKPNAPEARRFSSFYRVHYGFDGMLRPVLRLDARDRLVLYDVLVAYTLTDDALIERRADGREIEMPLDPSVATGAFVSAADGTRLAGWAAALDPPGRVDLIVVFDETGGEVSALAIPVRPRNEVAARYGLAPGTALAFTVESAHAADGRVVAVVDGRAVELDRTG